jgi:hypothetical protein
MGYMNKYLWGSLRLGYIYSQIISVRDMGVLTPPDGAIITIL